jgi:hypothetical protein
MKGGALYFQDSYFEDTNSVYKCNIIESLTNKDNSAFRGGVIKASSGLSFITGSKFQYNYAIDGGVFQIENDAELFLVNILAERNYALRNGGVI